MRASSAEVPFVDPHRFGQRHITEHRFLIEHVTEQDTSPEIDPTDGSPWTSERDDLGGIVEEQVGGRVRDWEHPVPFWSVDGQQRGGPPAGARVIELELELIRIDGVPEGGNDVAGGAGAAEDGDLVVFEGSVLVLGMREAAEPGGARERASSVDEVVLGLIIPEILSARMGDAEES